MASVSKRPNGRWRARYRDPGGKEHAKHFDRKADAQRWLDTVTADLVTGRYADPRAGRIPFRNYAEQWRASQQHRPSTASLYERTLRLHVYPVLGDRQMSSIKRSDVQGWVTGMTATHAAETVHGAYGRVATIFRSAVEDRLLPRPHAGESRYPRRVTAGSCRSPSTRSARSWTPPPTTCAR